MRDATPRSVQNTLTASIGPAPSQAVASAVPSSGVVSRQTTPLPPGRLLASEAFHCAWSSWAMRAGVQSAAAPQSLTVCGAPSAL